MVESIMYCPTSIYKALLSTMENRPIPPDYSKPSQELATIGGSSILD